MVKKSKAKAAETIALEPKNQTAFSKAVKNIKNSIRTRKEGEPKYRRGIIMVNHLPHGFFEDQLTSFFKQFGKVMRVRVGRSLKTGRSRGYAFIEFEFEEVAKIAAEAMNNYLMFERLIKCKVVDQGVNTKKIFAMSNVRESNYPTLTRRNELKAQQALPMETDEIEKEAEARLKRMEKHNAKLAELGVEYRFGDDDAAIPVQEKFVRKQKPFKPVKKPVDKIVRERREIKSKSPAVTPEKKLTPEKADKKSKSPKASPKQSTPKLDKKSKSPTATPKQASPSNLVKKNKSPKSTLKQPTPKNLNKKAKSPKASPVKLEKSESPAVAEIQVKVARKSDGVTTEKKRKSIKTEKEAKTPDSKATPVKLEKSESPAVAEKQVKVARKSDGVTIEGKRKSIKNDKNAKTPDSNKFSPKLLRSRARQSEAPTPVGSAKVKVEKTPVAAEKKRKSVKEVKTVKTPEKTNKFSPKLLRSKARQSDVSDLKSAAPAKLSPKKANRRKTLKL